MHGLVSPEYVEMQNAHERPDTRLRNMVLTAKSCVCESWLIFLAMCWEQMNEDKQTFPHAMALEIYVYVLWWDGTDCCRICSPSPNCVKSLDIWRCFSEDANNCIRRRKKRKTESYHIIFMCAIIVFDCWVSLSLYTFFSFILFFFMHAFSFPNLKLLLFIPYSLLAWAHTLSLHSFLGWLLSLLKRSHLTPDNKWQRSAISQHSIPPQSKRADPILSLFLSLSNISILCWKAQTHNFCQRKRKWLLACI